MTKKTDAPEADEPKAYQPTARDAAVEALAEAKHQKMMEELGLVDTATDESTDADGHGEPSTATDGHERPQTDTAGESGTEVAAPKVEDQVTKQMRKVKVDGEELEVSEDDLVASYQKQAAATRRLQQANEEAARIVAEAKAQAEQIKTPPQPEPTAEDRKAKYQEYHQALIEGDTEKAFELMEALTAGRQQPIPDVNEIVNRVKPVVKQELSNESALARFEKDYKDIIDDPYLVSATQIRLRELEAAGKPYAEALFEAGNATRDWLKSKAPVAPTETPTTTRAEKLEQKGRIVNLPTAHSKATATTETVETPADIIAQMRKARGMA